MKRSQTLWLGAAVGGLLGLAVAYMLSPTPKDDERNGPGVRSSSLLGKAGPADAVAIAQIVWSLLRRVQRIRGRSDAGNG